MSDARRRATRTAMSSPVGRELIAFVERPDIQAKLKAAADEDMPPIMAVSDAVLESFPPGTFNDLMNRRRLGMLIAATMEEAGYEPAQSNVRIKNPLFASGTTYRKAKIAASVDGELIPRIISVLSEEEARQVIERIIERFPSLKNKMRR